MPEGDTIHKLARALGAELVGAALVGGWVRTAPTTVLAGRTVDAVRAVGKHLFLTLSGRAGAGKIDGALVLQTHLGLHGSWQRHRRGEPWTAGRAAGRAARREPARASLVLETERHAYALIGAEEMALLGGGDDAAFVRARRLGPDLVLAAPPAAELVPRALRFAGPDAPLVDLLLDQRVACGVGNVYASEVLFARRLHPLTAVGALGPGELEDLYATAHRLLASNLVGGPRVTRPARDGRGHLYVYGRAGRPCFACGTAIEAARLGRGHRVTSWCPNCQVRARSTRAIIPAP